MSWKPFKSLLNNCRETTLLILKAEARQITFAEKVRMRYHLLYCNLCRRFRKQSRQLNHDLQQYTHSLEEHPPYQLSEEAKDKINDRLNRPS